MKQMLERTVGNTFLVFLYLVGMLGGVVYTNEVIAYAEEVNAANEEVLQEPVKLKKPTLLKKLRANRPRVV